MVYPGSKNRIAKQLLEIILKDRKPDQYYVEPFAGGFNMIDKVTGPRIGNDKNHYIIALFQAMMNGWMPPKDVDKETYLDVRKNPDKYDDHFVGYCGTCCTFNGMWMRAFAPNGYEYKDKNGKFYIYNYQTIKTNNILKQISNLKGIEISSVDYQNMVIPPNSIIYCDAPYTTTIKEKMYKDKFDFEMYYEWLRDMSKEHTVYVSEYNMPDDFECVLEIQMKSAFRNDKTHSVEKLFKLK